MAAEKPRRLGREERKDNLMGLRRNSARKTRDGSGRPETSACGVIIEFSKVNWCDLI
jgi:hypothetical protein